MPINRRCLIFLTLDDLKAARIINKGLTKIQIVDSLKDLTDNLEQELIQEYKELTGDYEFDHDKFIEWVGFLRDSQL